MSLRVNGYSEVAPQPNVHPTSKRLGMCARVTCLFFATLALLLSPVNGAESSACTAWKLKTVQFNEQVGTVVAHPSAEERALTNRLSTLRAIANGYGVFSSENCDVTNPDRAQAAQGCVQDQTALSATYDEIRLREMELAQATSRHPSYVPPAVIQYHHSQKPEGCS